MSSLKWKPKNEKGLIGVPDRGFIKAEDFNQKDLDNLIKRAKNRRIDVHSFLLNVGLLPVQEQVEIFDEQLKSEPVVEVPKRRTRQVKDNEVKSEE